MTTNDAAVDAISDFEKALRKVNEQFPAFRNSMRTEPEHAPPDDDLKARLEKAERDLAIYKERDAKHQSEKSEIRQERDAAIRERDDALEKWKTTCSNIDPVIIRMQTAERERDEARSELAREKLLREEAHKHERKAWYEADAAIRERDELRNANHRQSLTIDELQKVSRRLVGLLKDYGDHHPTCPGEGHCDCGWEQRSRAEIGEKP